VDEVGVINDQNTEEMFRRYVNQNPPAQQAQQQAQVVRNFDIEE
jgi:dolichyl-phosphate-mannose--protein O-mannosyl transferase